jgi:hypothetical protein
LNHNADELGEWQLRIGSVGIVNFNETTAKQIDSLEQSVSIVKEERNVTTSLLSHFLKYYGVEDAREIQEEIDDTSRFM